MNAQELINYIATSEKKTPVKLYIKEKLHLPMQSSVIILI